MRNGEKFFNCGVPIERRTRAPAPSACSRARNAFWIPLGVVMLIAFDVLKLKYAIDGNLGRFLRDGIVLVLVVNR